MVYQQKLVAVIKYNGKILREKDNSLVYLPFNSEYEILIKNLESRDCVVNISIDGQDVLDKQQLIVRANSSCSLEGFLKDNKVTNRFKFIQKTSKIQDYRGDKIDDGLIRIEYKFVKLNQNIISINHTHHHHHFETYETIWFHPYWCECHRCKTGRINLQNPYYCVTNSIIHSGVGSGGATYSVSGNVSTGVANGSSQPNTVGSAYNVNSNINNNIGEAKSNSARRENIHYPHIGPTITDDSSVNSDAFMPFIDNTEGITVKGSESNQKLESSQVSPLEDNAYTIILKLSGYNKTNQPVEKPLLVKSKVKCSSCGRQSKSSTKYCPECGTFLS